ncbi:coagulation factor IX [Aplochiton taeniatus]
MSELKVFLERSSAVKWIRIRRPRANFFLEEVLPGDLERECYEEMCSKEEVAEIFQTKEKTMEFWYRYKKLDQCHYNPCLNGGVCTVDRNGYLCLCPPPYHGKNCSTEVLECRYKNGGCLHYCTNQGQAVGVQCSCAEGYQLEEDGKSCSPSVAYPCGKKKQIEISYRRSLHGEPQEVPAVAPVNTTGGGSIAAAEGHPAWLNSTERGDNGTDHQEGEAGDGDARVVGGLLEKQGSSPWQVLLRRDDGYGFCGGTLIAPRWVVSAAHCLQQTPDHVTIGDYDKMRPDPDEQLIKVERVIVHPHFHDYTFDSDIALVYLSQAATLGHTAIPACLPNIHLAKQLQREGVHGVVTGWGAMQYLGRSSRFLRKVVLPVVEQQKCMLSTEQVVTDNMFCAGFLETAMDACSGDSGGPFVVNYRGTWFLTGVISWGEECAAKGKYGVYTRLGNYLRWIYDTMEKQKEKEIKPQV